MCTQRSTAQQPPRPASPEAHLVRETSADTGGGGRGTRPRPNAEGGAGRHACECALTAASLQPAAPVACTCAAPHTQHSFTRRGGCLAQFQAEPPSAGACLGPVACVRACARCVRTHVPSGGRLAGILPRTTSEVDPPLHAAMADGYRMGATGPFAWQAVITSATAAGKAHLANFHGGRLLEVCPGGVHDGDVVGLAPCTATRHAPRACAGELHACRCCARAPPVIANGCSSAQQQHAYALIYANASYINYHTCLSTAAAKSCPGAHPQGVSGVRQPAYMHI